MTPKLEMYSLLRGVAIIVMPPQKCGRCGHVSAWFLNENGETWCAECEPREEDACSTNM